MSIELIKKLREVTGSGIVECKNALLESNNDYDIALNILKKSQGHQSENNRIASKGLTNIVFDDHYAYLYEVNAETDFVSKNEHFKDLMTELGQLFIKYQPNHKMEALNLIINGVKVEERIKNVSNLIKENAYLRRFFKVSKSENEYFYTYIHHGGKVSSLVITNNQLSNIGKDLAMQVASNSPKYISQSNIDIDTLNYEKFMFEKEHQIFDDVKFNQYLESISLIHQRYIKDNDKLVLDILKENFTEIIDFYRFELGQGIEDKLNCKLDIPCDGSKITVKPVY